MKLHFQQSGGFAGLVKGCEVSVADLPARLARLATELAGGGVSGTPTDPAVRDGLQYHLSIEDSGKRLDLEFDPSSLPKRFTPLFDHLVSTSKPQPLR